MGGISRRGSSPIQPTSVIPPITLHAVAVPIGHDFRLRISCVDFGSQGFPRRGATIREACLRLWWTLLVAATAFAGKSRPSGSPVFGFGS